ncbi:MAG: helix-turn-helix domain-containing protein [Pseudomonadales bacterium]
MSEHEINILIVSAVDYRQNSMSSLLQRNGYTVFHSNTALYYSEQKKIDLIIADCRRGVDLLNSIMQTESTKIAVVALIDIVHGMRESVYSSGAWDYIMSPVIADELLIRVKSCLCLHKARDSNRPSSFDNNNHSPELEVYGVEKTRNSEIELVKKTCQFLLHDLSINHSRKELAYKMGTNRSKLAQVSKNVLGTGIYRWLIGERMKEAKRLCMATDLSIQEIGYRVGYSNPDSFSTAFKARFKLSPMQCRKNDKL